MAVLFTLNRATTLTDTIQETSGVLAQIDKSDQYGTDPVTSEIDSSMKSINSQLDNALQDADFTES